MALKCDPPAGCKAATFRLIKQMLKRQLREQLIAATAGRPGLSRLALPSTEFRVDLHGLRRETKFFETVEASINEDQLRRQKLLNSGQMNEADQHRAKVLAEQLKEGFDHGEPPSSLSSSLHMRGLRIITTGAVWELHVTLDHMRRSVFTLIPRGSSLTPEELAVFDVRPAKRALRSALNRAGAGEAHGVLIVFLHGEYDETTGRYQLHWHGWAAGEMVEVVRRLRKQRAYVSTEAARANDTDGVCNRVVVSRKSILNPDYRLSYLTQSFWPSRGTGVLAETKEGKGGRFRVRGKRRIPEPQHSQYLVWLDQWRIEDVSLLMGMSVVQGRLQLSDRAAYTNRGR